MNRTDDRYIKEKTTNKDHIEYARRFQYKIKEEIKKPGVTSSERAGKEKTLKWLNNIEKKFKSGEGLEEKSMI